MDSYSHTIRDALDRGLVQIGDGATVADSVRIVPREDDGSDSGPALIKPGATVRDNVVIGSGAIVGHDTVIGAQCVIRARAIIGPRSVISHFVCVERDAEIGEAVRVSAHTHLTGDCRVGNRVQIGARVVTINDRNLEWGHQPDLVAPVIEDDASVGSGSTLMAGVRIGAGAVVGAASLVLKDVPAGWVAFGHPAYAERPVS